MVNIAGFECQSAVLMIIGGYLMIIGSAFFYCGYYRNLFFLAILMIVGLLPIQSDDVAILVLYGLGRKEGTAVDMKEFRIFFSILMMVYVSIFCAASLLRSKIHMNRFGRNKGDDKGVDNVS